MKHPTCSRCSTTLVTAYIDGRHVDVCPRSTCEGDYKLVGIPAAGSGARTGRAGPTPAGAAPTEKAA